MSKKKFTDEQRKQLTDMIDTAINEECRFDKDHITSHAWDFFENEAADETLKMLEKAFENDDIETFDYINSYVIDEYLQRAMSKYETNHGLIRCYDGD